MDKEQAIDLLDNLIGMIEDNQDNDYDTAFRMAIDALKAQLSQEGTTSDMISRQAAIKAVCERECQEITPCEGKGECGAICALETLPSIQPDKSYTLWRESYEELKRRMDELTSCSDIISRQAAIDVVEAGRLTKLIDAETAVNGLMELPTVQPERKKGEWVEISSINHTYKCSECGRLLVNVADGRNNVSKHYPYCHCGADMRGELDDSHE